MIWWTVIAIVIFVLYGLICYYIALNGWAFFKHTNIKNYQKTYIAVIVFLSLSPFVGRIFPSTVLQITGGLWMTVIGYGLLILPIANILFIILKKKGLYWISAAVFSFYAIIFIVGFYNAWNPTVRTFAVEVGKPSEFPHLKMMMVSDLHLGEIVGKNHLQRLIRIAKLEKPDIILIPGDLIDDRIEPFLKEGMGEMLEKLTAPLGVYAVLGNHDYYGNDDDRLVEEMEKIGIQILQDESVLVHGDLYITGRKDRAAKERKSLTELVDGLNTEKPIILLDHQPYELREAEENGIDIVLSGHTHHGQLAPANWVTDLLFENDWGYLKKGNMHSFVSSGFGTWGPPLRIGSRSEVMMIDVKFLDESVIEKMRMKSDSLTESPFHQSSK